jgi:hypothetical protein
MGYSPANSIPSLVHTCQAFGRARRISTLFSDHSNRRKSWTLRPQAAGLDWSSRTKSVPQLTNRVVSRPAFTEFFRCASE